MGEKHVWGLLHTLLRYGTALLNVNFSILDSVRIFDIWRQIAWKVADSNAFYVLKIWGKAGVAAKVEGIVLNSFGSSVAAPTRELRTIPATMAQRTHPRESCVDIATFAEQKATYIKASVLP